MEGEFLVFKVFPLDRILQRCLSWNEFLSGLWSRSLIAPVGGGLQDFRPGQSSSASSSSPAGVHGSADGPGEGVFRTFPRKKKSAKIGPHSGSELSADFTSSTLAAHVDALSGVELLAKFQELSDHVGEMERRHSHEAQGVSSDITRLYRLITEARHRLQLVEAWAEEGTGDDDGPG